ncbi:phage tail protein I [Undibacterium rugosum]|uniref:phage tail protein I n=1 Tax=Undibacterium rugosum TaxID=2762291 RepID=UPI001E524DE7|nr:phage tail protein I [Undibacterium rugosum]
MIDLLPPNASVLERHVATAAAAIERVPVPLRDLINPDTCPVAFLPLLASAFSVDRWDANWSVEVKRAVIRSAFNLHKKKGTITALRRVVEPLGFLIRVVEWWQTQPPGPRGTFKLDIGVLDQGITDEMYVELERLIDDAKPVSRHMTGLAINSEVRGFARIGVAAYFGDEMTVYPYTPAVIASSGRYGGTGFMHSIDTMTIHPRTA